MRYGNARRDRPRVEPDESEKIEPPLRYYCIDPASKLAGPQALSNQRLIEGLATAMEIPSGRKRATR